MHKGIKTSLLLLIFTSAVFAQKIDTLSSGSPKKSELIFKPFLGLGVGTFSFYGDLYQNHFQPPMVGRIAYELYLTQDLTRTLQFNFYTLFGSVGANERSVNNNRNINFESQIRVGGGSLLYNFGNFLPKDRNASPYVSLGLESVEFLSKTDYYDAAGNQYYYWSDGSTRNKAQDAIDASSATVIHRDYTYESDIRTMNLDGFGKYSERTWAIPVGAGALININQYWKFRIGSTMHFTFTDYIDGIAANSTGNRAGNKAKDKFLMTSFSIAYNLGIKSNDKDEVFEESEEFGDYLAFDDGSDFDKDGVIDFIDSCQGTPPGVPVDAKGCPLDDDNDAIANYKDDELKTPLDLIVDPKGVQVNDSTIDYQYRFYMDSIGEFATLVYYDHTGKQRFNNLYQKEYTVKIGQFNQGIQPELMTKYLSIEDISSTTINDTTTIYTAGKYRTQIEAEQRKDQLITEGLTEASVIYKQSGKFYDVPSIPDQLKNKTPDSLNLMASASKNAVMRVQLGAYRNRLSKNIFKDIYDLIEIKTDDGLYKYMSGSFTSIDDAARYKTELLLRGYQGAFITAYKNGKRVPLKEAGAALPTQGIITEIADNKEVNVFSKKLLSFRIQVGFFKNEVPADRAAKLDNLKNISKDVTPNGFTRYTIGPFSDYASAQKAKDDFVKKGIEDAFILGLFNNEYISIEEALELLKN